MEESDIDLDYYSTVEELVELGPEKLKHVWPFNIMLLLSNLLLSVFVDYFILLGHFEFYWSVYIFFYQALAARGLKSGGTVQQRAERLFLLKVILKYWCYCYICYWPFIMPFELTIDYILQHTPLEQLDRKHFAKVPRTKDVSDAASNGNNFKDDMKKEIALMELKMKRLCELLDEVSSFLLLVCTLASFIHSRRMAYFTYKCN